MAIKKYSVALAVLLLKATGSLAQAPPPRPAPPLGPDYSQVSVPVPRAVTLLADVASTLFSRGNTGQSKVQDLLERRRKRSEKSDQNLTITVPNNSLTRTLGLAE